MLYPGSGYSMYIWCSQLRKGNSYFTITSYMVDFHRILVLTDSVVGRIKSIPGCLGVTIEFHPHISTRGSQRGWCIVSAKFL